MEGEEVPHADFGVVKITEISASRRPDEDYLSRVELALDRLLELSPTTRACRAYVKENVMTFYIMGLGPRQVLDCVPADEDDTNFFNPLLAGFIEREFLEVASSVSIFPEERERVEAWRKKFSERYPAQAGDSKADLGTGS